MVLGAGAQREVAENELKFSLRMEEENAGLDHSAKSQKMSLRWSFSTGDENARKMKDSGGPGGGGTARSRRK